jgi:hypothetical protein
MLQVEYGVVRIIFENFLNEVISIVATAICICYLVVAESTGLGCDPVPMAGLDQVVL